MPKIALKKFMGEKIFCGLDLGAQRLKASLLKTRGEEEFELLGIYESATQGFKDSSVSDLGELSESINAALTGLMKKTGVKIRDIQLGVSGDLLEARFSSAVIPLIDKGSRAISVGDVKRVNRQACLLGAKLEEEVVHEFPQVYRVDDTSVVLNPNGLYGRKLEVQLLLILSQAARLNSISKAIHSAGFEIAHLFFSSFAGAEACLNRKMKADGCVLVDIGSQATEILVFKDGFLKHYEHLKQGGDYATRSLAHGLNLSFDLAEDIKKSYAAVLTGEMPLEEEILVKKETAYIPIKREVICRGVEPDIDQLVNAIHQAVMSSQLYEQLKIGIVMIGGGSLLSGLIERVESKTNLPVSVGKVILTSNKFGNAALYSACIGLAQLGAAKGFSFALSSSGQEIPWSRQMVNKVKELYQEYF